MNTQIKYHVSGMTCGNCVKHVQAKLSEFAEDVIVTLDPPQAILVEPQKDINALNAELAKIGDYRLLPQAVPKTPIEIPELPSDKILRRAPTILIIVVAAIILLMLFFKK